MSKFGNVMSWIFNPIGTAFSKIPGVSGTPVGFLLNPFDAIFDSNSNANSFLNDPLNHENVKFNQNLATRQQDFYEDVTRGQMDMEREQFEYQKDYDEWAKNFAEDSYYNNYQNTVKDMQAAGLNPLALGPGGAGSASIASSSVSGTGAPSASAPSGVQGSNLAGSLFNLLGNLAGHKMSARSQGEIADLNSQTQMAVANQSAEVQKYGIDQQTIVALEQLKLQHAKTQDERDQIDAYIRLLNSQEYRQNQINEYTDRTGLLNEPSGAVGTPIAGALALGKKIFSHGKEEYNPKTYSSKKFGENNPAYQNWLSQPGVRKWHERTGSLPYSEDSYNHFKDTWHR